MSINTPLSVSGRFIVDARGNRVKLCGVNWAGAHQDDMAPGGLDYRHRDQIATQIAAWGFNSVRFPFALATVTATAPVPASLVTANPDLYGCTPWQVYQACVQALTRAGLMVIPNCHLLYQGWCCSDSDGNGLWWNGNWPPARFANGWITVARAFAGNPLVIGYDLKNEPRTATIGGTAYKPSWGDGNVSTDFRQLYSTTAARIQAVDSTALFFCEGLSYAADLTAAGAHPVTPGRGGCVVYSMHDYAWFHPSGQQQADYISSMDAKGGYLLTGGKAPVWVGEFGTGNDTPAAAGAGTAHGASSPGDWNLGAWFASFLAWAKLRDVDWCLWLLDGTMRKGTTPQANTLLFTDGDRSGYGLFAQDWTGVSSPALLHALQSIMPATLGRRVRRRRGLSHRIDGSESVA
jgi:endoglucanase